MISTTVVSLMIDTQVLIMPGITMRITCGSTTKPVVRQ